MLDAVKTVLECYIVLWREPIREVFEVSGWMADLSFMWISMFVATNLATAFWHGETLWGHFEGPDHPIRALISIGFFFALLPLLILAGFVTSRWEAQDTGYAIFMCWMGLLMSLSWLANAVAG